MLSLTTKEAIKVGFSITISICLALWFGWEKPYWAAIAVVVMAVNESFAHSIQKGKNRLLGTLLGTTYAFFLIAMFSQDRFMFIFFFTLFMALSLFMSTNEKHGYIFSIGFVVCAIVSCMGSFDSEMTFHFAVLRFQETLLGVLVFSFVFRLIWPMDTEKVFYQLIDGVQDELVKKLNGEGDLAGVPAKLGKAEQILGLPLTGSFELKQHKADWQERLQELKLISAHLKDADVAADREAYADLYEKLLGFDKHRPETHLISDKFSHYLDMHFSWPKPSKIEAFDARMWRVVQGVSMFLAAVALWIYMPVPGGFIFPMLAANLSAMLPTMPPVALKQAFWGVLGFGVIYVTEYVLLMPMMSELWELAVFYFINVVVVWKVFDSPALMIQRILGVNMLVVLTAGALSLTPSYSILTPLMMVVYLVIVLMLGKLFADLFKRTA